MGQITAEQYVERIRAGLVKKLEENINALPDGMNRDRFVLNCITVIQDMMADGKKRSKLQDVNIDTIPVCFMKGAFLGLDFFNGECYAIPYGKDMQFQTDYKGEIKVCKKFSHNAIKDIFAKNVRKGDVFQERIEGGKQNIIFEPQPFSDAEIIGTFAIVVFKDGSMLYDTMSKAEIEHIRKTYSKAANSPAWENSPGEMYKKTVIRRLCKLIDLDFDAVEQIRAFEDGGDATFDQMRITGTPQATLPDNGGVVNAFEQARTQQKEKDPVSAEDPSAETPKAQEQYENEFAQFEQQYDEAAAANDVQGGTQEELPFA